MGEDKKSTFGRIKANPDIMGGEPYLRRSEVPVKKIFDLMDMGFDDTQICNKLNTVTFKDIDACRAYKARFLHSKEIDSKERDPFFLIDENISYFNLPDVIDIFGPSSHVFAEGLIDEFNHDEKNIWVHAIQRRYKAILTHDTDFQVISAKWRDQIIKDYGSVENAPFALPAVIVTGNEQSRNLPDLLDLYCKEIREFVDKKPTPYARLSPSGITPVTPQKLGRGEHALTPVDYSALGHTLQPAL